MPQPKTNLTKISSYELRKRIDKYYREIDKIGIVLRNRQLEDYYGQFKRKAKCN